MHQLKKQRFWILTEKKMTGKADFNELAELEDLANNDADLQFTSNLVDQLWQMPSVELMEETVQKAIAAGKITRQSGQTSRFDKA
jgi:hypothetical protein